MQLAGKVAIVTGGSRGIGAAIAEQLGRQGARVVINYFGNTEEAEATQKLVEEAGGSAIIVRGDVTRAEDAQALVDAAIEAYGQVDILINNAGITRDGVFLRMKEEDWDAVMDTNLKGAFLMTKAVIRPMMKARGGRIINISSVVGVVGNVGQTNYSASKAGLIGFTKSCAKEFASRGILVNAVAPGFIHTQMTEVLPESVKEETLKQIPLGRMAEPVEVASLVAFLASDQASYITGQVLHVDGGMVM